jgi:thiamine pyrophosphate-dependent acetolactate synthase large subunit-like protein
MDTVSLFRPITKFSAEIDAPEAVSEVVANAFRAAESGRPGAAFISAPQDIMTGGAGGDVLTPAAPERLGPADAEAIAAATALINGAERPLLLLGLLASQPRAAEAVRVLLAKTKLPVWTTGTTTGPWRSYIPACSIELSKGRTTNPSTSLVSIRLSDAHAGVYARFAVVRRARMVARGW